jgi:hypothetical protein
MDGYRRHAIENDRRVRRRGHTREEREQARSARALVEGLEELWQGESRDEQAQEQSLRELTQ